MNPRSIAILANGPSLNDCGLERLRGVEGLDLLAINSPHPSIPLNDHHYWLFCDWEVAQRHADLLPQYTGTVISPLRLPEALHVMDFRILRGMGFSRCIADGYYIGRSSTYVALQFALEKQYRRIYLFGLDMEPENGHCFYGEHADPHNNPAIRSKRFEGEALFLKHAAYDMTNEERESVILCGRATGWDFTRYFQRLRPETAVGHILNSQRGEC